MSRAHEAPSQCAALMAQAQTAQQVAEQLMGKRGGCSCQRAQGPGTAEQQLIERRKVRDALQAKPLPELRKYAQELRDRYAKLLEETKQKPTFLSVPFNQYDGWLRDLDGRLQRAADAEFAGNEAEAKRELVRLYFDVQTDVELISKELDLPVDPLEFTLGTTVNTVTAVVGTAGDAVLEVGKVAKSFVEGSGTTSIGDRLLPTLSTGTKVVLGLLGAGFILSQLDT